MTADIGTVLERLSAQPASEKRIRNQLISEGCSIREATARAAQATRPPARAPQAASQKALTEAVTTAIRTATAARKTAKKAARRATAETAAARVLQERQQLAAQFTETAIGNSLREASSDDLAAITTTALSGTGQPGAAARPVAEVTVDPRSLDLGDMGVAAVAGMSGSSPFWSGNQTAGASPFWRGSAGAADA